MWSDDAWWAVSRFLLVLCKCMQFTTVCLSLKKKVFVECEWKYIGFQLISSRFWKCFLLLGYSRALELLNTLISISIHVFERARFVCVVLLPSFALVLLCFVAGSVMLSGARSYSHSIYRDMKDILEAEFCLKMRVQRICLFFNCKRSVICLIWSVRW